MAGKAAEAVYATLEANGTEKKVAQTQAESFFRDLEKACTKLAEHYKPKEGPPIPGR